MSQLRKMLGMLYREITLEDIATGQLFKGSVDIESHLKSLERMHFATEKDIVTKIRTRLLFGTEDVQKIIRMDKEQFLLFKKIHHFLKELKSSKDDMLSNLQKLRKQKEKFIEQVIAKRIAYMRTVESEARAAVTLADAEKYDAAFKKILPCLHSSKRRGLAGIFRVYTSLPDLLYKELVSCRDRLISGRIYVNKRVSVKETLAILSSELRILKNTGKSLSALLGDGKNNDKVAKKNPTVKDWLAKLFDWTVKFTAFDFVLVSSYLDADEMDLWLAMKEEEENMILALIAAHISCQNTMRSMTVMPAQDEQEKIARIKEILQN